MQKIVEKKYIVSVLELVQKAAIETGKINLEQLNEFDIFKKTK